MLYLNERKDGLLFPALQCSRALRGHMFNQSTADPDRWSLSTKCGADIPI